MGTQEQLSRVPSETEWGQIYELAKEQSLVGVCFVGLQRIGGDADEGFLSIGMNEAQYLDWMTSAASVQVKNEQVDAHCLELQSLLSDAGFRSCILKGQGVAELYGPDLGEFRQSGDIDVWMDGGFDRVNSWVQSVSPTNIINKHHVSLDLWDDTKVEAHFHPINLTNPRRQKKLVSFIERHEDECLSNVNDGSIHVPSADFNLVYLLVHIYHHLFTEGVGLRQCMDYCFALRASQEYTISNPLEIKETIKQLRLLPFADALFWLISYVFGVDLGPISSQVGVTPNQEDGEFLLSEIMLSGNFGKSDVRQKGLYHNKWNSFWTIQSKTIRFRRFDRWAWFWSPIERIKGFLWRSVHGYSQC